MGISPLTYSHPRLFSGWTIHFSHKVVNATSSPIGVEDEGQWGATKRRELWIQKLFMAKRLQFRLFLVPHITKCSYINAQSHQPVL